MLMTGRALTDAGRAIDVWTALQMDIAARHPDDETRRAADGFVAPLTLVADHGVFFRGGGGLGATASRMIPHFHCANGYVGQAGASNEHSNEPAQCHQLDALVVGEAVPRALPAIA